MNIGVRELRDGLSRHLAVVREGADITVTDHGKPVARLIPYNTASGLESAAAREMQARLAELDADVREAAQRRARAGRMSLMAAVSELARAGLDRQADSSQVFRNGFPVLAGSPEHRITDELVARYRDDV